MEATDSSKQLSAAFLGLVEKPIKIMHLYLRNWYPNAFGKKKEAISKTH